MTEPALPTPSAGEEQYWFNLKTLKVERGLLAPAPDRVGPFQTELEAEGALETLRQRSRLWRDEEEQDER